MPIRRGRPDERDALLNLWLRSVQATHHFLTRDVIESMIPLVRDKALAVLELWVWVDADDRPLGIMGLDGHQVDMLFVDPNHLRKGIGRSLLDHAQSMHPVLMLDVNEQNPAAWAFYLSIGFSEVGRSEVDGQGRPFPLVHLRRESSPSVGSPVRAEV